MPFLNHFLPVKDKAHVLKKIIFPDTKNYWGVGERKHEGVQWAWPLVTAKSSPGWGEA